jgi:hypothetical protein
MRGTLLAVSAATALLISFQAGKNWLADHDIHSNQLGIMERAVALEPGNADAWDRLGRFRQWSLENPDRSKALLDFKEALRHDPLSAHYWMDLASAYEATGDFANARRAYGQARSVYPSSAEVMWYYGNFLLGQQQYPEAFAEFQRAVRADSTLLPLAISRTWRATGDVNELLSQALPADVEAYLQALDYFASIQQIEPGLRVWQRLIELRKPFELSRSFRFLDELIRVDRAEEARRIWREALASAGLPENEPANRSLIWNGDFSRDFVNGGLGWRWASPLGATIDFDSPPPAHGARSVRLDFGGGANLDLSQPSEYVPVEPNRAYHFRAFLRTEGITTESGIRFSILDPHHSDSVNVLTEGLTGSHPWTAVDANVATGPQTHFVLVSLRRIPSRLFDNKLSGTAWMADVSLIASGTEARPTSR